MPVEGEDGVGVEVDGQDDVEGVGQVEAETGVADAYRLRSREAVGGDLRQQDPTGPGSAGKVIDGVMRRLQPERTARHVVELAKQCRRHDQRAGLVQDPARRRGVRMLLVKGSQQS